MPVYRVVEKATGVEVYRYNADAAVAWNAMGFDSHDHIEYVEPVYPAAPIEGVITERNISGVTYLRRFTQGERIAIRAAATQSPVLDDYLKLLDATIAQGGVVNIADPDTITAVNMLEQAGLIGAGRAGEILNG